MKISSFGAHCSKPQHLSVRHPNVMGKSWAKLCQGLAKMTTLASYIRKARLQTPDT